MTRDQEQVRAVRDAGFSKYDKTLHTKCKKPELYGIQRVEAAEAAIAKEAPTTPRKAKRRFPCQLTCRLPKSEYTLLQQAFALNEAKTMQDFTRGILIEAAARLIKEKTASDAGTSKAARSQMNYLHYSRD